MSNITFSTVKAELDEVRQEIEANDETDSESPSEDRSIESSEESDIDSNIESSDVSSVEMTESDSSDEEEVEERSSLDEAHAFGDHMSIDSDQENTDVNDDKIIEEIRYYQRTTHDIIPFENFELLVREIMQDHNKDLDIDDEALKALQTATESYLVKLFAKTQMNAVHAGRQVIMPKDMNLARYHAKERE